MHFVSSPELSNLLDRPISVIRGWVAEKGKNREKKEKRIEKNCDKNATKLSAKYIWFCIAHNNIRDTFNAEITAKNKLKITGKKLSSNVNDKRDQGPI